MEEGQEDLYVETNVFVEDREQQHSDVRLLIFIAPYVCCGSLMCVCVWVCVGVGGGVCVCMCVGVCVCVWGCVCLYGS